MISGILQSKDRLLISRQSRPHQCLMFLMFLILKNFEPEKTFSHCKFSRNFYSYKRKKFWNSVWNFLRTFRTNANLQLLDLRPSVVVVWPAQCTVLCTVSHAPSSTMTCQRQWCSNARVRREKSSNLSGCPW